MAKDPTQGPLSTYDEFGNPIKANVDMPAEDVAAENEATEEVGEAVVPNETGDDIDFRVEGGVEKAAAEEEETFEKAPESEEALEGEEPAQADVSVEGEPAAEDVAQPIGEDPVEEIERAEVGGETEKMPKEEEEFVTHEHEVKPPLTYNEAETMLMETSFVKMREMAIADGIKPDRSRVKVMRQLLEYWFPAPTSAPADDEPEMSVRIRRAKGLM